MQTITFKIEDQIAFLGLNRPQKRNAINRTMIEEIISVLTDIRSKNTYRCLILFGEGDIFCSGADLEWMMKGIKQSKTDNIEDAKMFTELFSLLHRFPKPVICEVSMLAFGGAIGLLACSDIVVCEEEAMLGFPEVKLGLIPATIAPYVFKKMGSSNIRKRLLFPDSFTAQEAQQEGLIHYVKHKDDLRKCVLKIANSIKQAAPDALLQTKDLIHKMEDTFEDETTHLFCARLIANARATHEGQEGVRAFFAKEKPSWAN